MRQAAILIQSDGDAKGVVPANGGDFTLEELQSLVEGYIEIVPLTKNIIMVVNEEGKGMLPPNPAATVIAKAQNAIFPYDYIAGNALMCPSEMVK
jgi:hypothetical protein